MNVNAAGTIAPPMIVYKYNRFPSEISSAVPDNWGMGRSKSGWMTTGSFFEYICNIFEPWLVERNIVRPIILFLDGHASHLTIELSDFCVSHQIEVIPLYPNATHVLQPLDVGLFHPVKTEWKKIVADWRLDNSGARITKIEFPKLLSDAIASITLRQIESAFRATGICPFSINSIDFKKLILKRNKFTGALLPFVNDDDVNSTSTTLNNGEILEYFESKITPQKLEKFKKCSGTPTSVDPEDRSLLKVWKRMREPSTNVETSSMRQLFVDVGINSSINLSDIALHSTLSDSNDLSPIEPILTTETSLLSPPNSNEQSVNESIIIRHSTPMRAIKTPEKYAEDFGSALKWPALADTETNAASTSRKKKKNFL
jgi:hypothetical protein